MYTPHYTKKKGLILSKYAHTVISESDPFCSVDFHQECSRRRLNYHLIYVLENRPFSSIENCPLISLCILIIFSRITVCFPLWKRDIVVTFSIQPFVTNTLPVSADVSSTVSIVVAITMFYVYF